ncbi:hypothetical protein BH24ACT15_BH24ACT15_18770 [soil metagenome]
MTTTPSRLTARRLRPGESGTVMRALESDFGRLADGVWDARHHYLLDALDRGQTDRFVVCGDDLPRAVAHLGTSGTVVPAGDPAAAEELAPFVERSRWRILIGDEDMARALLEVSRRGWWRRQPSVRVQRLMVLGPERLVDSAPVGGFRRAGREDLDVLEDFACLLHVEDRMGPALTGSARQGVRHRMAESVSRGLTWVVQRDGRPVGKVDLSLYSTGRGAQIAGVYVDHDYRDQGVATGMITTLSRQLLDKGLPVITLHVREDNRAAQTAYERAGFSQQGRWVLALR